MARNLPKVCPFLVTVDLKLKWPELPSGPNYPALPYRNIISASYALAKGLSLVSAINKCSSSLFVEAH